MRISTVSLDWITSVLRDRGVLDSEGTREFYMARMYVGALVEKREGLLAVSKCTSRPFMGRIWAFLILITGVLLCACCVRAVCGLCAECSQ